MNRTSRRLPVSASASIAAAGTSIRQRRLLLRWRKRRPT